MKILFWKIFLAAVAAVNCNVECGTENYCDVTVVTHDPASLNNCPEVDSDQTTFMWIKDEGNVSNKSNYSIPEVTSKNEGKCQFTHTYSQLHSHPHSRRNLTDICT